MERTVAKVYFEDDGNMWKLKVAYTDRPDDITLYHMDSHDRSRPKFDLYSMIGMTVEQLFECVRDAWISKEAHV